MKVYRNTKKTDETPTRAKCLKQSEEHGVLSKPGPIKPPLEFGLKLGSGLWLDLGLALGLCLCLWYSSYLKGDQAKRSNTNRKFGTDDFI